MRETVWQRVAEAMRAKDMSQASLARALGMEPQRIHNWKKRGVPRGELVEIARALDVTAEWLAGAVEARSARPPASRGTEGLAVAEPSADRTYAVAPIGRPTPVARRLAQRIIGDSAANLLSDDDCALLEQLTNRLEGR